MNIRISDHEDYLNELRHQYCISTGNRMIELKKQIFKEIADSYNRNLKKKIEREHDHDQDFLEECHQRDLDEQLNEKIVYYSACPE